VTLADGGTINLTEPCVNGAFSSTITLPGADGPKTIVASQTINGRTLQDSISVIKDSTAPVLSISASTWQVNGLLVVGTCESLDGNSVGVTGAASATPAPCANNLFSMLLTLSAGDGTKAFEIFQLDRAGNRGSARGQHTLDTRAPLVTITAPANGANITDSFSLSGACETGLDVSVSGTGVLSPVTGSCAGGQYNILANPSAGLGNKAVTVSQTDASLNRGQASATFIRVAPTIPPPAITIGAPAANSLHRAGLTLTGTCQTGLTVTVSGAVNANSTAACVNGAYSAAVTFSSGEGNKTLSVSQTNAQNATGSASRNFLKDTLAPALSLTSPVANAMTGQAVLIAGACESGLNVMFTGTGLAANGSTPCAGGIFSATAPLSAGDGTKQINVTQTDSAGNTASVARSVQKDTVAPSVRITGPAAGTAAESGITITGTCETGIMVSAGGTGAASDVQGSCANQAFSIAVVFSAGDGGKLITVRQSDPSGNLGTDSRSFLKTPPSLDGPALYATHCAGCHGALNVSIKRNRTAAQITGAIATINPMNTLPTLAALSPAQIGAIADALRDSNPGSGAQQVFACTPGQQARTPMAKLTNREFRNALGALLDDFSATLKNDSQLVTLLGQLPADTVLTDRNTFKEQSFLVTQDMVSRYFEASFHAGGLVAANAAGLQNYPNTAGCLAQSAITQACHRSFAREFGSRAFRRALSSQEGNSLSDSLFDTTLSKAQLLQLTVTAMVQMPDFLYKAYDTGTVNSIGPTVLNLTAHELAAKLAFFITGAPPDATLRGLANSGQILNSAVLSQEIDRLLLLPAAQDMVRRMFRETYGYDIYGNFQYGSTFLNGQSTVNLAAAMTRELDDFFVGIVLTGNGSFQDLMTSRQSNVTETSLAQLYGVPTQGNHTLPPTRAGFLNRASMLAKRSGNYSSPIHRGLNVLEHILCEEIGPPPASAPTSIVPPDPAQYLTTRERTARTSEAAGSVCIGCHSRMNPIGYSFEHFDSIGRLRTTERIFNTDGTMVLANLPVNTQATTLELAPAPVAMASSQDLASSLGTSEKALMCLVRNIKRFEARVVPGASDNCQMNSALTSLYGTAGTQGSVKAAIKSLIMSDEFRRWNFQ